MKTIPPYNDDDRELEEDIRTFEKSRDIDDDDVPRALVFRGRASQIRTTRRLRYRSRTRTKATRNVRGR